MRTPRLAPVLGLCLAACAGGGVTPPVEEVASVRVTNDSQYRIDELRFHRGASYRDAENLLEGPMDTGAQLITAKPVDGVPSIDVADGLKLCWG